MCTQYNIFLMEDILYGKTQHVPSIVEEFAEYAVVKYALLKYPHLALNFDFSSDPEPEEGYSFHKIAMFSLLVNRHDDKAYEIFKKYELDHYFLDLDLDPLFYCSLDEFPPASKSMCEYLQSEFSLSANWCYYITGWSIMGDYNLPGLKYAGDHEKLAERLGKVLPEHTIELRLLRGIYDYCPFIPCEVEYPEPLGEGIEKDLNQPLSASSLTQKLGNEPDDKYKYIKPSCFKEKQPTFKLACDLEGFAVFNEYMGRSRDIRLLTQGF
jgi:hypothetical protein